MMYLKENGNTKNLIIVSKHKVKTSLVWIVTVVFLIGFGAGILTNSIMSANTASYNTEALRGKS